MSDTVLVTGATGGLGRILAPMLQAEGRTVIATGRDAAKGAELARQGLHFVQADLVRDPLEPLLAGVGTVFHLAALSAPWGREETFQAINVRATERLLDAAQAAGCRRFIFASTPSIYTRDAHQIGLTERAPLPARYANSYAETKHAAERAVLKSGRDGFSAVALRPRAILGPFDTALLPRLLRAAQKGILPLPGGGRALIEPTDARDAARAFVAAEAVAEQVNGRAFNISCGTPIPVAKLATHVFARLDRNVWIIAIPPRFAVKAGAFMESIARRLPRQPEPLFTRYSAMVLGWSQTFDLTAARQSLGWEPEHAPLASADWALKEMGYA